MNNGAGQARKASRIAARPGGMSHGTDRIVNDGKYNNICMDKASMTTGMAFR
jgi:hypothetical protein